MKEYNRWITMILMVVVIIVVAQNRLQRKELESLKETVDYLTAPENEVVIVVNENLKSKQDRTRIKIEDIVASNHYSTLPTEQTQNLARIVVKYSERYKVPVNLVLATMTVESAFNPYAISPVGAMGLLQVMPSTAADIARELRVKEYDLFDTDTSVRFGTYYLRKMLRTFNGDMEKAVRAYNTGAENVSRERYVDETVAYHKSVVGLYGWLEQSNH